MKTFLKLFASLFVLVFVIHPVSAQGLLKKIQQKATEKIEQRVEQKANEQVDKKIDEALDKVEESIESEKPEEPGATVSGNQAQQQKRMGNILKGMGISGNPVPYNDSYAFNHLIQMTVKNYSKSGKLDDEGVINTLFSTNSKSMAYEVVSGDMAQKGQGKFIIDAENGAMIILSEDKGEKTGIVYGINSFFQSIGQTYNTEDIKTADSPEAYLANPNVTKTGRSKTISGYKCDEYIYKDENAESEMWVTKDLKLNSQDFFGSLFKISMYSGGIGWGYPMEITSTDKSSGNKSFMQVTKVDQNSGTKFSMKDYQITNLGSLTMPAAGQESPEK